jgi:hypothetical protein
LALLAALLLPSRPARVQPRVTLKLENVTLPEALKAVRREVGWEFKIGRRPLQDAEEDPKAPRAGFSWTSASVGRVCRRLGDAFGMKVRIFEPRSVEFMPGGTKAPPPLREASREGFTFLIAGASKEAEASAVLGKPGPPVVSRSQSLTLLIRPESGDPDVLTGLADLTVVTDRGPVEDEFQEMLLRAVSGDGSPDEWNIRIPLDRAPAGAREIIRLSGTLIARSAPPWEPIKVSLPSAGELPERAGGAAPFRVRRLDLSPFGRVALDLEVSIPAAEPQNGLGGLDWPPTLLQVRSGRAYPMSVRPESSTDGKTQRLLFHAVGRAPRPDDPPAAVLFEIPRAPGPDRRIPFEIRNIPLPTLPLDRPAPGAKRP